MGDSLRRGFIIFMVVLFLVTSLGIGVWGFIEATRQDNSAKNPTDDSTACAFESVPGAETLPVPEPFKPGKDVTALEISDIEVGSGAEAKSGSCVTTKYHGTLASDGTKFDGDFDQPEAIKFPLGKGSVIAGWDQGLVGMRVGGTRRLVIPSEMAYGPQAQGAIPANADLVFVVKLLAVE